MQSNSGLLQNIFNLYSINQKYHCIRCTETKSTSKNHHFLGSCPKRLGNWKYDDIFTKLVPEKFTELESGLKRISDIRKTRQDRSSSVESSRKWTGVRRPKTTTCKQNLLWCLTDAFFLLSQCGRISRSTMWAQLRRQEMLVRNFRNPNYLSQYENVYPSHEFQADSISEEPHERNYPWLILPTFSSLDMAWATKLVLVGNLAHILALIAAHLITASKLFSVKACRLQNYPCWPSDRSEGGLYVNS